MLLPWLRETKLDVSLSLCMTALLYEMEDKCVWLHQGTYWVVTIKATFS